MYPLKFKPIYIEKIWSGDKIKELKNDESLDNVGISWELSAHRNADTVISNGAFSGMKLSEAIEQNGERLIGTKLDKTQILRAAILDAAQNLSIQVHPYQEYASLHENDNGKNETWYIMDAEEDAYIIAGTTTTDVNVLKEAVLNGTLEDYIVKVPVKKGDITVIKTGLLHALGKGVLAVEIGENGDTTYRFYDYNRGRALDIEKSFDVLNPNEKCFKPKHLSIKYNGYTRTYCYVNKEYAIELIDVATKYENKSDPERYYIYVCVEGSGSIIYNSGVENIKKGDSIFMPASIGEYSFEGNCRLMKCYIPNTEKSKNEILSNVTI